jgi:hypothetical protein
MTIPGRTDAARLLRSLEPPPWFVAHVCAVADIAGWIAARTRMAGTAVDQSLVEAAALLHDVDKLPTAGVPGHLRHGDGSAAWLAARGLDELGPAVRDHPVTRLADDGWVDWSRTASTEARIVAYADKRAGQHLEPMSERFAGWRRRYPSGPGAPEDVGHRPPHGGGSSTAPTGPGWEDAIALLVERRARELEHDVCVAAGVDPGDVRRLRWSRRALRRAAS